MTELCSENPGDLTVWRIYEKESQGPISRWQRKGDGGGSEWGGDVNTGPEAIGLGGSRPQASRDAWENEGQSFPLVSRLNYVADKGLTEEEE